MYLCKNKHTSFPAQFNTYIGENKEIESRARIGPFVSTDDFVGTVNQINFGDNFLQR